MSADRGIQPGTERRIVATTDRHPAVWKGWVNDTLIGGLGGGVIGAIVAVNIVIYSGFERGYESTIPEVFRESGLIGSLVVAILVAGPLVGVWIARRVRHQRGDS
jgi:predicted membrane protein